jgi:uncharacterized protein (DUF1684 family)
VDAAAYEAEVERWHAHRVARLTAPDGWLSLTGLYWLQQGENGVGSDPANLVVLPRGPARAGTIELGGLGLAAWADPNTGVTFDGTSPNGPTAIRTDAEPDGPTVLRLGPVSFYVIDREGRLAVRVKDTEQPARQRFSGIRRFPVDPRWRVGARFERHPDGTTVLAPDVLGSAQTYRNPGTLRFRLDGTMHTLEAFREPDEEELFIVFGDATNGSETFAGGRYLYAPPPDGQGRVVLDFNRAYNPPCVFTEYATCVLPLPANRLPVRIEAGELRYGEH